LYEYQRVFLLIGRGLDTESVLIGMKGEGWGAIGIIRVLDAQLWGKSDIISGAHPAEDPLGSQSVCQ